MTMPLLESLEEPLDSVRVKFDDAQEILLKCLFRLVGGKARFFQIKHIGLNVYEVRLLPDRWTETLFVEDWIS